MMEVTDLFLTRRFIDQLKPGDWGVLICTCRTWKSLYSAPMFVQAVRDWLENRKANILSTHYATRLLALCYSLGRTAGGWGPITHFHQRRVGRHEAGFTCMPGLQRNTQIRIARAWAFESANPLAWIISRDEVQQGKQYLISDDIPDAWAESVAGFTHTMARHLASVALALEDDSAHQAAINLQQPMLKVRHSPFLGSEIRNLKFASKRHRNSARDLICRAVAYRLSELATHPFLADQVVALLLQMESTPELAWHLWLEKPRTAFAASIVARQHETDLWCRQAQRLNNTQLVVLFSLICEDDSFRLGACPWDHRMDTAATRPPLCPLTMATCGRNMSLVALDTWQQMVGARHRAVHTSLCYLENGHR